MACYNFVNDTSFAECGSLGTLICVQIEEVESFGEGKNGKRVQAHNSCLDAGE